MRSGESSLSLSLCLFSRKERMNQNLIQSLVLLFRSERVPNVLGHTRPGTVGRSTGW